MFAWIDFVPSWKVNQKHPSFYRPTTQQVLITIGFYANLRRQKFISINGQSFLLRENESGIGTITLLLAIRQNRYF